MPYCLTWNTSLSLSLPLSYPPLLLPAVYCFAYIVAGTTRPTFASYSLFILKMLWFRLLLAMPVFALLVYGVWAHGDIWRGLSALNLAAWERRHIWASWRQTDTHTYTKEGASLPFSDSCCEFSFLLLLTYVCAPYLNRIDSSFFFINYRSPFFALFRLFHSYLYCI